MQEDIFINAKNHGWWDKERIVGDMLCLLHSEVSEAWTCWKNKEIDTTISDSGKPEGFFTEIADVIIRVLDMAGGASIDISKAINEVDKFPCNIDSVPDFLCYINKTISDALEDHRNSFTNRYGDNLARVVVRCFRFDGSLDEQKKCLLDEIVLKHEYNKTRSYRHGNKVI